MEDLTVSTLPVSAGAGFWIRAGARLIDVFYGIALGFVGGVLAGISLAILDRSGLITPGWQDRIHGTNLAGWGLSLLGGFLYHTMTEGIYGASLGKLICQLRVVRENGGPIGLGNAAIRSLGYYIDALFFGLIAYSSMKQSALNQRYGGAHGGDPLERAAGGIGQGGGDVCPGPVDGECLLDGAERPGADCACNLNRPG